MIVRTLELEPLIFVVKMRSITYLKNQNVLLSLSKKGRDKKGRGCGFKRLSLTGKVVNDSLIGLLEKQANGCSSP